MKNRLNITIDESLVEKAKRYAAKNNTSLSGLIEEYFKKLVSHTSPKKENFLEMVEKLPKPKASFENIAMEDYFKDRKKKYGF
ncbi:MAG: DUF6364 family protein [Agriterribacter sp.]